MRYFTYLGISYRAKLSSQADPGEVTNPSKNSPDTGMCLACFGLGSGVGASGPCWVEPELAILSCLLTRAAKKPTLLSCLLTSFSPHRMKRSLRK